MNLLLNIADLYIPAIIKKKKLQELFELTADAFESEMPLLRNLSYDELLEAYARFTRAMAEKMVQPDEEIPVARDRLYQNAYRLGERLRRDFRIRSESEVMHLSKILYRMLKIDFSGNAGGEVMIRHCFFSHYYTPEVCRIISALDEGLLSGLSNGGRLVFNERITEGKTCCLAVFNQRGIAT